ncbi:unnamed protein product [Schistosoma turkestanicum]|nr:unnamed protein product [Schistosoma turkestanicum]
MRHINFYFILLHLFLLHQFSENKGIKPTKQKLISTLREVDRQQNAFNSNPPLREKNNRNYIKCLDNDLKIRHQIKLTTGLSRFFLEFSIYEVQMIIIFRDDHLNFIQLEL